MKYELVISNIKKHIEEKIQPEIDLCVNDAGEVKIECRYKIALLIDQLIEAEKCVKYLGRLQNENSNR